MDTDASNPAIKDDMSQSLESGPKFRIDVGRISATMKEKCALLESKLKEIKSPESIEKMLKSAKLKDLSEKQNMIGNQQQTVGNAPPHLPPPYPTLPPTSNNTSDQFVTYLTKTILDTFNGLSTKITDLDRNLREDYTSSHKQSQSAEIDQIKKEMIRLKDDIVDTKNNFVELSTKVDLLSTSMMVSKQYIARKKHSHRIKNRKDKDKDKDKQLIEQPVNKQQNRYLPSKHHLNTILFV